MTYSLFLPTLDFVESSMQSHVSRVHVMYPNMQATYTRGAEVQDHMDQEHPATRHAHLIIFTKKHGRDKGISREG